MLKKLLYFIVKGISRIILKVYFKTIVVINSEVITDDPIILPCNHNNLFVDAMLMVGFVKRPLNFIMARISVDYYPIIGFFIKFLYVLLVNRPQDFQKNGEGKILKIDKKILIGRKTKFLKNLKPQDKIKINKTEQYLVTKVISDTKIEIKDENITKDFEEEGMDYKILPKPPQDKNLYNDILDSFERKEILCLFPEGTSHDKPFMMPFKAGVANFIYLTKKERNIDVKMIPCSINYLGAHKFRSTIFVNFGNPVVYSFDKTRFNEKGYKREIIGKMLIDIKKKVEETKISAPTYGELRDLYLIKDLITDGTILEQKDKFFFYLKLCNFYNQNIKNEKLKKLMKKIGFFRKTLKGNLIRITDIKEDTVLKKKRLRIIFLEFFAYFFLLFPALILIHPFRIILNKLAEKERVKNQNSSYAYTRILSTDLIASEKIFKSMIILPILLHGYTLVFFIIYYYYYRNLLFAVIFSISFFFIFSNYLIFSNYFYDRLKKIGFLLIQKIRMKVVSDQSIINYLEDLINMKYDFTLKFLKIYYSCENKESEDITMIIPKEKLNEEYFLKQKETLLNSLKTYYKK